MSECLKVIAMQHEGKNVCYYSGRSRWRACIVIYGSLSSPTTTRLRHNHVRFTNTCIIYTDLFRRRAYAGGLLQSYSVRVKSTVTRHALSVLFYGKIRSHQ